MLELSFYTEGEMEEKAEKTDGRYRFEDEVIYIDNNRYGRGGYVVSYDVIETGSVGDTETATLQLYSDAAKTLKAYKVTYSVRVCDGDICLTGPCEIIEDTGRSIWRIIV